MGFGETGVCRFFKIRSVIIDQLFNHVISSIKGESMENNSNCFHFHVCYLSCELKDMLPLFCQFLVVRILERIQNLSNEKCSGCAKNYRFSSLHPCVKTSLTERIDMFLPQAKTEALEKMDRLITLFQQSFNLLQNKEAYLQIGITFVENLLPKQVIDRRFINEDTEEMFQYDDGWVTFEADVLSNLCQSLIEDYDFDSAPKKATPKRKAMKGPPNDNDEAATDESRSNKKQKT